MNEDDEPISWRDTPGKWRWVICDRCDGHGKVDHPAFSNGISAEEWNGPDWDDDSREGHLAGRYDVPCDAKCHGGKVKEPILAHLSFGETGDDYNDVLMMLRAT